MEGELRVRLFGEGADPQERAGVLKNEPPRVYLDSDPSRGYAYDELIGTVIVVPWGTDPTLMRSLCDQGFWIEEELPF